MIIKGLDQFKTGYQDIILDEISKINGKVLKPTISLCHHCYYHIPAYRYELNNSIYICKHCLVHGVSHHMVERDADFYHSLKKSYNPWANYDDHVLVEVTDRCNLECPHCYHLPDNKIKDIALESIISRIKTYPKQLTKIVLAGAEASLRRDLDQLVSNIDRLGLFPIILTNGIKFADEDFVSRLKKNGTENFVVNFGLNHSSYLGNKSIRDKQLKGIVNAGKHLKIGYIGYTMTNMHLELHDILTEILNNNWKGIAFRIRCGSEIGRNSTDSPIFVSDLYKAVKEWAHANNVRVWDIPADDNIYHKQIQLGSKHIRLIHWCDQTNIDLEELRTGPWNDFVPDGITNFLHQVIRRDIWKNNKQQLPDIVPLRYQVEGQLKNEFIFDREHHVALNSSS
jgi:hypothetical protein